MNLFDIYEVEQGVHLSRSRRIGTPSAIIEMLVYSRPGQSSCCPLAAPGRPPLGVGWDPWRLRRRPQLEERQGHPGDAESVGGRSTTSSRQHAEDGQPPAR